jgi:hypothetical protein
MIIIIMEVSYASFGHTERKAFWLRTAGTLRRCASATRPSQARARTRSSVILAALPKDRTPLSNAPGVRIADAVPDRVAMLPPPADLEERANTGRVTFTPLLA